MRRLTAVAIVCPTLDLTELLPCLSAAGWPCRAGEGTGGELPSGRAGEGIGGELPSGRKRTSPGGEILQLFLGKFCCSGLEWLLLEVVVSEEFS